jgi:Ca-activated chloride channel family protein
MASRPIFLCVLLISLAAGAAAQNMATSEGAVQPAPPVFRSGAELVALTVAVTDRDQHFVRGLTATDFAVYEDGVRQDVSFFAASEAPLDLMLLIDSSASMTQKIKEAQEAALGFLRTLRPGDRGAVVSFNDGVQVRQGLTKDRDALEAAVRSTGAHGATALNNAIYVALKEFGRSAKQGGDIRRQAIAVLSDGEDTCSLMTFDDVLVEAKKAGVGVYTISLRGRPTGQTGAFSTAIYSMKTLAQETGARAFFPTSINDLSAVYSSIADELDHQYALGYASKNLRGDGRFRRVVVQVVTRPELRLRTRTGYFADRGSLPRVIAARNAKMNGER